jgi:hypothetical protein
MNNGHDDCSTPYCPNCHPDLPKTRNSDDDDTYTPQLVEKLPEPEGEEFQDEVVIVSPKNYSIQEAYVGQQEAIPNSPQAAHALAQAPPSDLSTEAPVEHPPQWYEGMEPTQPNLAGCKTLDEVRARCQEWGLHHGAYLIQLRASKEGSSDEYVKATLVCNKARKQEAKNDDTLAPATRRSSCTQYCCPGKSPCTMQ